MLRNTLINSQLTGRPTRSFITVTLAALTQSKWLKEIRMADEFEHQQSTTTPKSKSQELAEASSIFSKKLPDGRILISPAERAILFAVSLTNSFFHPEVGYNINNFGEVSSFEWVLKNLRDQMLRTESGRKILRERPQLNSATLDRNRLKELPANTLGHHYHKFTADNDDRAPVKFIADEELAYVFLRYRQIHDIVHILTESKVDLAGELPVKAFEFGNTGLPMTGLACLAYFKLSDKRKKRVNMLDGFLNGLSATPLVTVRWEDMMHRDVDELRHELGIHK